MEKFWKSALAIGGIAAIGSFFLYALYKDWLKLPIFEKLSQYQTFVIMVIFLILTFLAFSLAIVTHIRVSRPNSNTPQVISNHGADGAIPQKVRWGPVDGLPAGIKVLGSENIFIPWQLLHTEITKKLLPQFEYIPTECSVELDDYKNKEDWIVKILNKEKNEVAHIWFGPDPNGLWKYDGLVRVGVTGSPPMVWQTFQRYSDNSYRGI